MLLHEALDAVDIRVFAVLDRFDGRDCIPSLARIAERIKTSEQTVRRAIRRLQLVGAITVEARHAAGRQTSNRYALAGDSPLPRVAPRPSTGDRAGVSPVIGTGVSPVIGDPEQEDPEQLNKTSVRPSAGRVGPSGPTFKDFYALYPRREKPRAAETAWNSAVKRAKPEVIMAALQARVEWWERARTPRDKIRHPATWLNADSWLDELGPTPEQAATGMVQAAADLAVRQRDEVERAIADGDSALAWKLTRARARGRGDHWFDEVAQYLGESAHPSVVAAVRKRDGTRVTADEVEQVKQAWAAIEKACLKPLSLAGAQSTLAALEGPS